MTLKFSEPVNNLTPANPESTVNRPQVEYEYKPVMVGIPNPPPGLPMGMPLYTHVSVTRKVNSIPPMAMPGANLSRAINYYADYGGCGFWRMLFPEILMNANQRAIMNGLTTMVLDPRFYQGIKAVRLQRQATPAQLQFVNFLREISDKYFKNKIIYEIDDIIFKDDIPDFNRCKEAFDNEDILKSSMEMMRMSSEISVTCEFMKDYYKHKTGNKNITVVPNYPPRFWADGFYNEKEINKNYNKNKKRPRIGYCGSGTHIDVANKTGQRDDFTHIVDYIIKTRKDFQWVMMGCFPLPLKPLIDNGEIELANWAPLFYYPREMHKLNLNAVIAPLADCNFNRAKSNIKYLEAACQGTPGVFQDLVTYKDAPLRFKTGSELIDQLNKLLKDENTYMKYSKLARSYADTMWLDDHLDEHLELYFTPYGDKDRKALLKYNPEQKI